MVEICGFHSVAYSVNVRQLGSGYLRQSERTIFILVIIYCVIISILGVSLELSVAFLEYKTRHRQTICPLEKNIFFFRMLHVRKNYFMFDL